MTEVKSGSMSSTHSKASTLFGLDEDDRSGILVYRYRSGCKALEQTSQHDLCRELDADPNLEYMRVTKKEIPRGNSRVEIKTADMLLPEDLETHFEKPTLYTSLANVGLTRMQRFKHMLFNSYPELYIVSRQHSPVSSRRTTPESSQHNTFQVDTPHPLQKSSSSS
ncbi:hypothetical protein BU23DRAFT_445893 [Bimuria novae-zelandiae CBS 107.79]|uniref:Uncharacterized protein n=1 Tax=Bimuria novae-zelandiae CBS 107.79 TaxID=1447943 RepID=A0A6A5VSU9_9PLEO|nr:hypothetical protein BU23DRAFT_445893 [Bimuria novae-zelandiae CBS 107.79]